ncbi:DUF397 domain-containing protein [Streptomyces sp. PT12]|uniref:DUF397 domain-containing protein n=1 Tax=Streptomyces sp. PT12 TaxID=1510197 RepID=UPI000DE1FE0F|nr:DUF397 domain-containing protein [Streptomyces sp. PT12]RBM19072.1 hypothetical protein DEH69_11775 [Streptomyces sp. PT12]
MSGIWITSSYSEANGNCVELAALNGARWTTSSRSSDNGQCVEVARVTDVVAMRDSKLGEQSPVLAVPTPPVVGVPPHPLTRHPTRPTRASALTCRSHRVT